MSNATMLNTFPVADISTAHITRQDDALLREDAEWYLDDTAPVDHKPEHLHVCPKDQGWWVHVNSDWVLRRDAKPSLLQRGYSRAMLNLIELAATQQCYWLLLEADSVRYPDLPIFDW